MAVPTKEQAETYKIMIDMALKTIFALVVIVTFIVLIYKACVSNDWKQTASFIGGDALLGRILFVAFKHYFPNTDINKSEEQSNSTATPN